MFKGINDEYKKTHKKEIFRAMCGSGTGLDAWSYIPSLLSMIKNLFFIMALHHMIKHIFKHCMTLWKFLGTMVFII